MLETFEQLRNLVNTIEDDVRKAAGGNRAAGTRVRKFMQDIKEKAQELRVKVLENRDGSSAAAPAPGTPAPGTGSGGNPPTQA